MHYLIFVSAAVLGTISLAVTAQEECVGFCFPEDSVGPQADSFEQHVPFRALVEVPATLPVGIHNLTIELKSPVDVDIQLYDIENNKALIGWNNNALIESAQPSSAPYQGVTIEYSGYEGDGDGNESINIVGRLPVTLKMKLYGYNSGQATVHYTYEASETTRQHDSFEQYVPADDVIEVPGIIPADIEDLSIQLDADMDVDIQLFDIDSHQALVGWKIGAFLNRGYPSSQQYNGVMIEYSGYYGIGKACVDQGKEYINISGVTRNRMAMKLYGYEAGRAKVSYSWKQP